MKGGRKFPVFRILAGVVVVLVGAVFVWKISIRSANRQRIDAIAARGEPISLATLDKFYKAVPDAENAALLWLAGTSLVWRPDDSFRWDSFELPRKAVAVDEPQLKYARELISSNQQALAVFRRAAALSKSRYPGNPGDYYLPHHPKLKVSALGVLRAETFVAVGDGDTSRAAVAIDSMVAAGRSLAREPTMVSQLVRYAIDILSVHTLQFALNHASLTELDLQALVKTFAAADDPESLALGLIGERAEFISKMRNFKGLQLTDVEDSVDQKVLPLIRATGFLERDMRFGIDALTTNLALARLPDPRKFLSHTNVAAIIADAKSGYYILSAIFLGALEKTFIRDATHRAYIRVAQLSLAIERFRLANNGKLPDHLSALVPAYLDKIPIDPFDGKPVRFKTLQTGYVVYSIGADEKDDGGAERVPNAPKGSPEDVTFIVERK